jgi:hypothetical protein
MRPPISGCRSDIKSDCLPTELEAITAAMHLAKQLGFSNFRHDRSLHPNFIICNYGALVCRLDPSCVYENPRTSLGMSFYNRATDQYVCNVALFEWVIPENTGRWAMVVAETNLAPILLGHGSDSAVKW